MTCVLVTGGLGFLGRSLTRRLLDLGHQVLVVDDLSTAVVAPEHFAGEPRVRIVVGPIEGFRLDGPPPEVVFHLASPVGSVGILRLAGRVGAAITGQTAAVLDLACAARARVVLVSTSEVYGQEAQQEEGGTCTIPAANTVRLEYALGKRLAEAMVANRMTRAALPYAVVRPFNVAGPWQSHAGGFVLPTFVRQALLGQDVTVFGDGLQRRAFGHVEDVVEGIARCAAAPPGEHVFNLGCPHNRTTILDLARAVVAGTGGQARIVHVDPCALHGPQYSESFEKLPDVSRAWRVLGWQPTRTLQQILADVLAHARARMAPVATGR